MSPTAKTKKRRSPRRTKSQEGAAAKLGVSARTLMRWEKAVWWRSVFRNSSGYDIEAIKLAHAEHTSEQEASSGVDEARKIAFEAKKVDLKIRESKLAERNRDLISVERVEEILGLHTQRLVSSLEQLPLLLAKIVSGKANKQSLFTEGQNVVRRVLRAYGTDVETELQNLVDAA